MSYFKTYCLNYIVNQIDLSYKNSINSCVDNFTRVINEVANPLFSKVFCIKHNQSRNNGPINAHLTIPQV